MSLIRNRKRFNSYNFYQKHVKFFGEKLTLKDLNELPMVSYVPNFQEDWDCKQALGQAPFTLCPKNENPQADQKATLPESLGRPPAGRLQNQS
jgi:hypothetical protein